VDPETKTPMSSVGKRLLGNKLRSRRKELKRTLEDIAKTLGWSVMSYQRLEVANWKRVRDLDFRAVLGALDITDPAEIARYMDALEAARRSGWWKDYPDVFDGSYVSMESEARYISGLQILYVPGLLQCPEYIKAIHTPSPYLPEHGAERRIEARVERQEEIFARTNTPAMSFVLDEFVLQFASEIGVGSEQAQHLVHRIESNSGLTVQVLPKAERRESGLHTRPFIILDFADPTLTLLYSEGGLKPDYIDEPEVISSYRQSFADVCGHALSPYKSLEIIKGYMK